MLILTLNPGKAASQCDRQTQERVLSLNLRASHQKHRSVAASRPFLSTKQYPPSRYSLSAISTDRVSTELDPSCNFDWMLGLALAGCAFEAYNGLENGPEGSPEPLCSESAGGTRVTYLDPDFLRKKMDGILEVTIRGAKGLKSADMLGGKSDPYCIVSCGGSSARTPIIENDNNPTWEHKALLFVQNLKSQRLNVRVLDSDLVNSDDLLGSGLRGIADLGDGKEIEVEVPLTGNTGTVTLKLQYEAFTEDEDLLRAATVARMGGPVVGAPAEAVLTSPWRTLCKAVIPTSAADDYLGLDALAFIDNPTADTQVWVFWNQPQKRIVVAYRGTESSRLKDVLTDLQLNPTSLDPEGSAQASNDSPIGAMVKGFGAMLKGFQDKENDGDMAITDENKPEGEMWAHSGFYNAYKAVQAEVIQIVDAITAGEGKEWSIFVTGHSLGGALSTLGAYEFATRRQWTGGKPSVVNYSYGSPRVGNRVFAYSFNKAVPNAWRVVNNNDAVALVPRMLGYAHVGHLVKLTSEGDVIVELHSAAGTGEGADMGELAAGVVFAAMGKESTEGVVDSADDLSAIIKEEIDAMNNLLDGSGVAEHMEPLYLENLEIAIKKYFTKGAKILLLRLAIEMPVNVGSRRHLSAGLPRLTRHNSVNASKRNTWHSRNIAGFRMAQRRALQNISHICNSSTSQTEGWRSGTATSWAVGINRNIVVAVDASEDSIAAFEWALRNLYRHGDAVHILHVVPALHDAPASGSLYYPRYDPIGCEQSLWNQAEQFFQDEFVTVAQERGIVANVVLVRESKGHDIGQVVCQEAEKLEASPLVMFSHQKSRMEEFFLGSVSRYCATTCKRPVLFVHPAQAYGS